MAHDSHDEKVMSFWEHLEELRWVIFKCLAALAVGAGISLAATGQIFALLMRPIHNLGNQVEVFYSAPVEAFLIKLQMAILGGAVLAAPFIVIFVWSFVAPGLTDKERKACYLGGGSGFIFFCIGLAFGYFMLSIVLPLLTRFGVAGIQQRWLLKNYMNFCFRLLLGVGVAFELPVILYMLVRVGLVEIRTLERARPYAVVVVLVLSAILTPPDIFTQMMLGIPMMLLYELGILAAKWHEKLFPPRDDDDDDDEADEDEMPDDDDEGPDATPPQPGPDAGDGAPEPASTYDYEESDDAYWDDYEYDFPEEQDYIGATQQTEQPGRAEGGKKKKGKRIQKKPTIRRTSLNRSIRRDGTNRTSPHRHGKKPNR